MRYFPSTHFLFREHPHNLYNFLYDLKDCKVIGYLGRRDNSSEIVHISLYFIFGYKLFIIENKNRSDRTKQRLEALVCNRFRQYGPRMLNYLEGKFPDYYARLQEVISVGVAPQSIQSKLHVL
jgi:hypothetical protein